MEIYNTFGHINLKNMVKLGFFFLIWFITKIIFIRIGNMRENIGNALSKLNEIHLLLEKTDNLRWIYSHIATKNNIWLR